MGEIAQTKKKLLVSFSGGETSAFMAVWLWLNLRHEYDMIFVFANTGEENEETLLFVKRCSEYFGFTVIWVEAAVNPEYRKGTTHKIVNYETAFRPDFTKENPYAGSPFEDVIIKYGIPNISHPHCSRELKQRPIEDYADSIGWKDHYTAIGIRKDEFDRMNNDREALRLIYPLVNMKPMDKPRINFWWSQQPFRLGLKGYEGNCRACWKKSLNKQLQIAKERPESFRFPLAMESKYGNYIPKERAELQEKKGVVVELPITFFRDKRSAAQILYMSKTFAGSVKNDAADLNFQTDLLETESCEIFTNCV